MDKQLYRALLMLVNDKKSMELLIEYAEAKIALHHKQLEDSKDHHDILRLQGAIAELRRFKTLRDEVIKGAE